MFKKLMFCFAALAAVSLTACNTVKVLARTSNAAASTFKTL